MTSFPKPLGPVPETEAGFQQAVITLARMHGWLVAHFRPARTESGGWATPVQADGAGFPDLVLVRDRVIFAELKTNGGRLRPAQTRWLDALADAGAEAAVWRPVDWHVIVEALSRKGAA